MQPYIQARSAGSRASLLTAASCPRRSCSTPARRPSTAAAPATCWPAASAASAGRTASGPARSPPAVSTIVPGVTSEIMRLLLCQRRTWRWGAPRPSLTCCGATGRSWRWTGIPTPAASPRARRASAGGRWAAWVNTSPATF